MTMSRRASGVGVDFESVRLDRSGRKVQTVFQKLAVGGMKMTGYTVHTGSSKKFISGWDRVFKKGGTTGKKKAAEPASEKSATTGKKK